MNRSRPRYSQLAVRRLNSSNHHHTGAEKQKSSTKSLRERDQIELPARVQTKASTAKRSQAKAEKTDKPSAPPAASSSKASKPPPPPARPNHVPAKIEFFESCLRNHR